MSLSAKDNIVLSKSLQDSDSSDSDADAPPQRQTSAPFNLAQKDRSRLDSRRRSLSPSSNSSLRNSRSSSIPTSIPESNHSIDNYQLGKTIGKGNFAKVKVATHTITGSEVAVKIIDKNNMTESSLAKLLREVKIMKMLRHPNIVELYEVIETEDTLYLIMEYASGGEVFDFLVEHGRMKEKVARQKFRQILSAVEYCHAQGIVHRDLKAENLLLDHDMNVKIADFGFSNYYTPGVKLDTFCGSPPYAAPELFQGKKYDGPEVDVWSLGVILYTLVSGSLPFDGANLKELRERVLRGKYRIPFYMSEECEQLLRKFLVLVPARRMSLRAVLDAEWINIESEQLTPHENPDLSKDGFNTCALAEMLKVGFVRESIEEALKGQAFDHVHATYELFSRKHPDNNHQPELDEIFTPPPTPIQRPQSVGSVRIVPMSELNSGSSTPTIDESDTDLLQTPREKPRLTRRATDGVAQRLVKQQIKQSALVNNNPPVNAVQPAPVQQLAELHLRGRTVSDSPQPPQRKNSFMRRRFSRSVVQPNASPIKIGDAEPRVLRFTFSRTNTTDKPPKELMRDVVVVLVKNKVQYQQQEPFVLVCAFGEELRFEIEICKLPRLSMHGIKHKRIAGESLGYKNICTKILNDLNM